MRSKIRILIVEDQEDLRATTAEILGSLGYEIIEAEDGVAALKLLQAKNLPSLIVSDIQMPRIDGYELVSTVRDNPRLAHIPVILLSSEPALNRIAPSLEVNAYIAKSSLLENLIPQVDRILKVSPSC